MLDKFRYRRMTAAIADVCGAKGGEALFVGCSSLARLVAASQPGLTVSGDIAPREVNLDAYRARTANAVVAWGELGDVAAVASPLVAGGQLLWFSTLAPELAAGRALCGGLSDIKQRQTGRVLLTIGTRSHVA